MQKKILITGSTDGIGLETAKILVAQGHSVLLHGRNPDKLAKTVRLLSELPGAATIDSYTADLSRRSEVESLAQAVIANHSSLDVLINNAGIFRTPDPITAEGLDIRFMVNTLAPYLLTQRLRPLLDAKSRVINLSSAAQSPVDTAALTGQVRLNDDFAAYAQSKLALTQWSRHLALALKATGPCIIAVNPGSLLASKMVKEGFGVAGNDLKIGAEVLVEAALSEKFSSASGQYFDNDKQQFSSPHPDASDPKKSAELVRVIERVLGL